MTWNSPDYFRVPTIQPLGFREYDARWIIEPTDGGDVDLNYRGVTLIGHALGNYLQTLPNVEPSIVVGHDYRRYSEHVKNALVLGLLQSGMRVRDIGLAMTPVSYFSQSALGIPCVAMVTASHNPNGWTGVKMGSRPSSTFGPDEMAAFKGQVLAMMEDPPTSCDLKSSDYAFGAMDEAYLSDLVDRWSPRFEGLPRVSVAVEAGNGTGGMYLPAILQRLGFPIAAGNVEPDWDFPHFNPNPEDIEFLQAVGQLVKRNGADIGLCIDGDGDRLGVVDENGTLVFSDRVGLLIARHLESVFGTDRPFVIDVKSTSLFETELKSPIAWAKTGHSYVKAKVEETSARAGFERSGHFFFTEPLGRGYDDACVAALALLWVLTSEKRKAPESSLSGLLAGFPHSFSSPNRQPKVSDAEKYEIVERIAAVLGTRQEFGGRRVVDVNRLNGIRITLDNKSWLLVRASSNAPCLVIVAETFDEDGSELARIDQDLRDLLRDEGIVVGDFAPLSEIS